MPWKKTFIFWGDERHVPTNNPENNANMAQTRFISRVPVPEKNVYPVPVQLSADEAASAYEKTITRFFGNKPPAFNMILLGLGADGHTASLFPGTSVINEKLPGIRSVFLPEKKINRITMTAPMINMAENILFLVTGEDKAGVLATVLSASCDPKNFPACLIKPENGKLYWFADLNAAGTMSSGK
jgi:6-phosphogluconolactonase